MKRPREKIDGHLAYVRGLPCLTCGDPTSTEAAHVRYSDGRAAKWSSGMGEKPSDMFVVPLCGKCHRSQHTMNERQWWQEKNIDPIQTAAFLYCAQGDHARGEVILQNARPQTTRHDAAKHHSREAIAGIQNDRNSHSD